MRTSSDMNFNVTFMTASQRAVLWLPTREEMERQISEAFNLLEQRLDTLGITVQCQPLALARTAT